MFKQNLYALIITIFFSACSKVTERYYYPTGELEKVITQIDDSTNQIDNYYKNGKLKCTYSVLKNEINGAFDFYDTTGLLKYRQMWRRGKRSFGIYEYDSQGMRILNNNVTLTLDTLDTARVGLNYFNALKFSNARGKVSVYLFCYPGEKRWDRSITDSIGKINIDCPEIVIFKNQAKFTFTPGNSGDRYIYGVLIDSVAYNIIATYKFKFRLLTEK